MFFLYILVLFILHFFSQDILKFIRFSHLFLYILFTFPTEMRVENVHFCPITAFLPFLFLSSEGVKTVLEATFSALLITFSAAPRRKSPPSFLPAFVAPKDKISR